MADLPNLEARDALYKLPGVVQADSLVIDFPLSFFESKAVGEEDANPLLLMISEKRSVLIDLQAFTGPKTGVLPARCWVNRKLKREGHCLATAPGLLAPAWLMDNTNEKYKEEKELLDAYGEDNVTALLPEKELREIMISYEHFALVHKYLLTLDTKAANATDLHFFFKAFIYYLKKLNAQQLKAYDNGPIWQAQFDICSKETEENQTEYQVTLNDAEKDRWRALFVQIAHECGMQWSL